jgi:hypothetical protein
MAAKTNQQKQKRTELKKLLTHYTVLSRRKFRVRKSDVARIKNLSQYFGRKLFFLTKTFGPLRIVGNELYRSSM